jgi:hypothetical protein
MKSKVKKRYSNRDVVTKLEKLTRQLTKAISRMDNLAFTFKEKGQSLPMVVFKQLEGQPEIDEELLKGMQNPYLSNFNVWDRLAITMHNRRVRAGQIKDTFPYSSNVNQ